MAKIVDPDVLAVTIDAVGTTEEIRIQTATKTIELRVLGDLDNTSPGSDSGITMQALYSFLKEEWKDQPDLNKYRFPLKSFTKNEFQWINGWSPLAGATRSMLRDAGWEETVGANAGDIWAGMISLGQFDEATDQGYYTQLSGTAPTSTPNFLHTGNVNEAVLVQDFDAGAPGDLQGYFQAYLREQGKLYSSYNLLSEQNILFPPGLEATLYRFPLGSNSVDLNVVAADATIDADAPYTGMNVRYYGGTGFTTAAAQAYSAGAVVQDGVGRWAFCTVGGTVTTPGGAYSAFGGGTWVAYEGEKSLDGNVTYKAFNVVIEGNGGLRGQIYEWGQRQLRRATNINLGTIVSAPQDTVGDVFGNVADELSTFRGADLVLKQGVYIDNFASSEINNLLFVPIPVDNGVPAEIRFPFEVVVTLNLPANVTGDATMRGVAYFTNDDAPGANAGNDFDTAGAIIVEDNTPVDVDFLVGDLTGNAFIFSYDYDGNVQRGGGSGGSPAPVTLQLCGLEGFEVGTTEFTIAEVATLTVNVVASDERNYLNA